MEMAARLSLGLPMTFEYFGAELRLFEGWALHALVEFRILYMNNLNSCFRLLPRRTCPSNIWVACPGLRHHPSTLKSSLKISLGASDPLAPRGEPGGGGEGTQSLPAWLHNIFREEMGCSSRALALERGEIYRGAGTCTDPNTEQDYARGFLGSMFVRQLSRWLSRCLVTKETPSLGYWRQ
ncbi:hypothetical protein EDB84DRAFT_1192242 [Lactarius hengduanensis]|nr:hypothetical protein EDB84DRAFT_1192242 [Lactarius hengduanensis]